MTSGEKRFARRLEQFLEDDYLCWYDVPLGGRSEHPDFIVLHPQRGLLILEVKDWRLETIRQIDRQEATILTDRGLKVVPNPLEQARQYAYQVIKPLERDPQLVHPPGSSLQGRLMLPFGHGVVLANITRAQFEQQELGEVIPGNRVICRDEMTESQDPEEFQKRLWDMFTVQFRIGCRCRRSTGSAGICSPRSASARAACSTMRPTRTRPNPRPKCSRT